MSIENTVGNSDEARRLAEAADKERLGGNQEEVETKNNVIVVDGPLAIYATAELNRMFSKESSVMQAVAMQEDKEYHEQDANLEKPRKLPPYIYVFNARDSANASKDHFNRIMEALRSGKYSEVRVIADAAEGMDRNIDLVTETAARAGARVNVTANLSNTLGLYRGR